MRSITTMARLAGVGLLLAASTAGARPYLELGQTLTDYESRLDLALGARLVAGYRFTDHVALEGGYAALGSASFSDVDADYRVDGYLAGAKLSWPLSSRWSLTGRAGYFSYRSEVDFGDGRLSGSDADPYFGLGAEVNFQRGTYLGAGYQRLRVHGLNPAVLGVYFGWRF